MPELIKTNNSVRAPFTTQDVRDIENLCEDLIKKIQTESGGWESVFAKQTAEDLMDVIIDIKADLSAWGKEKAVLMHDDGFCDPVNTGENDG